MGKTNNDKGKKNYRSIMTVANIRDAGAKDCCEIMFLESTRFYRLHGNNRKFKKLQTFFQEAMSNSRPVEVELESVDSDIILDASIV